MVWRYTPVVMAMNLRLVPPAAAAIAPVPPKPNCVSPPTMAWMSAGGAMRTTSVLTPYFLKVPLSCAIHIAAVAATGCAYDTFTVAGGAFAAALPADEPPGGALAAALAAAGAVCWAVPPQPEARTRTAVKTGIRAAFMARDSTFLRAAAAHRARARGAGIDCVISLTQESAHGHQHRRYSRSRSRRHLPRAQSVP